jgi:hypothetical protein
MSGRQVVILKLLATPAVTALVGDRIWPGVARQGTAAPFLILHTPGQQNRQLLEGDAGYPRSRVRIECVAASAAAAEALGKAVFEALKNVTNETIADDKSPTEFSAIATITPTDFETDGYSDARTAFTHILDFYVDWRLSA